MTMAGLRGQDRSPSAPVRERRNFDNLASVLDFIGPDEVIQVDEEGVFVLILKSTGGLLNDAGQLSIKLDTNPGLGLSAGGIKVDLRDTIPGLELVASGLGVLLDSTEPGLQLTSGLKILLASDPGLEFSSGLRAKIKSSGGITRDSNGLSVTWPHGKLTVTSVQTGTLTATAGQIVRCDPSGGGFTVNLPDATNLAGEIIIIKNVTSSTNTITVDGDAAQTIDGAATATITTAFGVMRLISDAANWMVI
jgi:hypothetical protein